jgi:hypothetical protein
MSHKNILAVYQLANVADKIDGQSWYPVAYSVACTLADQYNVSPIVAAGVIAALSPRNRWERNIANAENMLRVHSVDPDSIESVKVCTFGHNKAKAIRILQENPETESEVCSILSGPKLQEFFSCIVGIDGEVCIDGHAYSVWIGDRITVDSVPRISKKLRAQIKADYAQAAKIAGIKSSEMQAVTWCAWRRIHGVG